VVTLSSARTQCQCQYLHLPWLLEQGSKNEINCICCTAAQGARASAGIVASAGILADDTWPMYIRL